MKKFILSMIFTMLIVPVASSAQTASELQAKIAEMQKRLYQLQLQLQAQSQIKKSGEWCYTFNKNLRQENSGTEIEALQQALTKEGFAVDLKGTAFSSLYGAKTTEAVSKFQEKYRKEILSPIGLFRGTGYVGLATRNKLNSLYGCTDKTKVKEYGVYKKVYLDQKFELEQEIAIVQDYNGMQILRTGTIFDCAKPDIFCGEKIPLTVSFQGDKTEVELAVSESKIVNGVTISLLEIKNGELHPKGYARVAVFVIHKSP